MSALKIQNKANGRGLAIADFRLAIGVAAEDAEVLQKWEIDNWNLAMRSLPPPNRRDTIWQQRWLKVGVRDQGLVVGYFGFRLPAQFAAAR